MRLQGKVALITGGARGIGRTAALLFAAEGAVVAVCDVDPEAGRQTVSEIEQQGGRGYFYQVDVADRAGVQAMVEALKEAAGRIDVLVNNAGITRDALLSKMTEEAWDQVIAINLKGVFNCTQAVVPIMVSQGRGKIINVASVVATYGNIGQTNYAASKGGIVAMTKTWAKELGPKGITVNAVAPGFIETEMTARVPEHILEQVRQRTPLRRLGRAEEVAQVYLFLASDEADFINGAVIPVDGGLVL